MEVKLEIFVTDSSENCGGEEYGGGIRPFDIDRRYVGNGVRRHSVLECSECREYDGIQMAIYMFHPFLFIQSEVVVA